MDLSPAQLNHCIGIATEIANRYAKEYPRLNAEEIARDVESLLWVCSMYVEKWIKTMEADDPELTMEKMTVWGSTIVTDEGYEIITVQGLDEPWHRFVVTKEAFQVVFDKAGVRNMDLMSHVEEMATIASFPASDPTMTPAAAVELMAEVAAMEFLFPYAKRIEELKNGANDWAAIAKKYNVPQHYVELYLSSKSMEDMRPYHQ